MDTHWIRVPVDGSSHRSETDGSKPPGLGSQPEANVRQPDHRLLKQLIAQPDRVASIEELTEILNEIDRLRDPG